MPSVCTGFLVLPGLLFWVGLSREDLLHGLYLALLLVPFLASALQLEPHVSLAALHPRQVTCSTQLCPSLHAVHALPALPAAQALPAVPALRLLRGVGMPSRHCNLS